MDDVEGIGPTDDVPEADAAEQQQPTDYDDEDTLETVYPSTVDLEADAADVIDQATVVADPHDEWGYDR